MLNTQSLEVERVINRLLITKLIEQLAKELEDTTDDAERRLGCRESIEYLASILEDAFLWTAENELSLSRDEVTGAVTAMMTTLVDDRHWLVDDCHVALTEKASAPLTIGGAAWPSD